MKDRVTGGIIGFLFAFSLLASMGMNPVVSEKNGGFIYQTKDPNFNSSLILFYDGTQLYRVFDASRLSDANRKYENDMGRFALHSIK